MLVVTYFLLELHAYNFRPIVWFGRPFYRCIAQFQGHLDVKASIIEAFATFLLLSYTRILCVSFDLLVPTQVYDKHGKSLGLYLYYDGGIHFLERNIFHMPFSSSHCYSMCFLCCFCCCIHCSVFRGVLAIAGVAGLAYTSLLMLFRAATRMEQWVELETVDTLQQCTSLSG